MSERVTCLGGSVGAWEVVSMSSIAGERLEPVERIGAASGATLDPTGDARWDLLRTVGPVRYASRREIDIRLRRRA